MLNSSRQSKVVQKSIYGFINHTAGLGIIELGKYLAAKSFINITISDCYWTLITLIKGGKELNQSQW